jgi:hypothetical protein
MERRPALRWLVLATLLWFALPTAAQPAPAPRNGHRMAYDTARRLTLVFGGRDPAKRALGDTWGWDGAAWRLLAATGPAPRAWSALAYDSRRGVTVLFGGRDSTQAPLGDTWEWDGTAWRLVATTGPAARDHHAMAYDPTRGRVVLYGGYHNGHSIPETVFTDTWEWDGTAWQSVEAAGPGLRSAHHLDFDPGRGEVVLSGGRTRFDVVATDADVWSWNGRRWQRVGGHSVGRSHFAMAYEPGCACLLRFGGGDSLRVHQGDTWRFRENRWERLSPGVAPEARVDPGMVWDRHHNRLVLFGGYVPDGKGPVYGDVWEWDGHAWLRRN